MPVPVALSISLSAALSGRSRTAIDDLIAERVLDTRVVGCRRMVERRSLEWLCGRQFTAADILAAEARLEPSRAAARTRRYEGAPHAAA